MLDANTTSVFGKCFLSLDRRDRSALERVEYSRAKRDLVFYFRGGSSSPPIKIENDLTDFELREEEQRLRGILAEQVPPITGVTISVVDKGHATVAIPKCSVLFVGGPEDGRIVKGFDAQPFVISLKTGAPRLRGHRVEVLASRSVEAARAGGYTMDHLRRVYSKYGVAPSQQVANNYELSEVDGDLYIYRHTP